MNIASAYRSPSIIIDTEVIGVCNPSRCFNNAASESRYISKETESRLYGIFHRPPNGHSVLYSTDVNKRPENEIVPINNDDESENLQDDIVLWLRALEKRKVNEEMRDAYINLIFILERIYTQNWEIVLRNVRKKLVDSHMLRSLPKDGILNGHCFNGDELSTITKVLKFARASGSLPDGICERHAMMLSCMRKTIHFSITTESNNRFAVERWLYDYIMKLVLAAE